MTAVIKKELRQYIATPVGAVFLSAYFAFSGYYFTVGILLPARANLSGLFESSFSVLMVLIPLLTMRSFAEERKQKTDQLLLTSPESVRNITLGKFFSALLVFLIGSISMFPPVIVLSRLGAFELLETVGNFAALLLVGSAFIAIGIFASALTENQIVAAVISYVIMLGLWLLDYLRYYTDDRFVAKIIEYLSFRAHFNLLGNGVFSLATVVYFLSLVILMLALTCLLTEHRRVR